MGAVEAVLDSWEDHYRKSSVTIEPSVGIRSLAVSFPSTIRTNGYWRKKYPEWVEKLQPKRAKLYRSVATSDNDELDIWSQEVAPYLSDPFRGNVERQVLSSGESSMMLEYRAARDAIKAAKLSPEEVDLAIACSLFPEYIAPGKAADLARQLELQCPAWNLESACSSAMVALQNACVLVRTGEYRNVLVIVSYMGSNSVDENDTLSWSVGDGAGGFLVDSLKPNQGILGTKIVHIAATCGAYTYELETDAQSQPRILARKGENASLLAETAVKFVRTCCEGAAAGVTFEQIDFFAFNTPTAWYASVCARALGIAPERTINLYPRYANIGPVLPIANLYHAALTGKIRENDLVLVYSNGAAATAVATVMRWGDVALGSVPALPIEVSQQEKIHQAGKTSLSSKKASLSREKLFFASPEERRQMLETALLEWLASSLQLPINQLNSQQSFASLLDSLMAFELRRRIEADLQVRVSIKRFFGENNVAQLAEILPNQLALANLIASDSVLSANTNEEEGKEKLSL